MSGNHNVIDEATSGKLCIRCQVSVATVVVRAEHLCR